jgi:hypothetical protein
LAVLTLERVKASETIRLSANSLRRNRNAGSPWPARSFVKFCAIALAILLSRAAEISGQTQTAPSVEYQVKAAFLPNFARFIDWPQDPTQSEKAPITICVFRYDPFGSALDEIIQGRNINNRQVLARRIKELVELKTCQIVFVSEREDKLLPEILNNLKGASVLVVGESDAFAERGGTIQFFLENNKLRFAINVDAAERARLNVSSKLLALARIVHDQRTTKGN